MPPKMGRAKARKQFKWMGGGLVTRYDDMQAELLQKGKLFSPLVYDIDFFKSGSIRSRNAFAQAGASLGTSQSVNGLWDLRFASAGALVQFYGAASDGNLYAGNPSTVDGGGSWSDPIYAGGASSLNQLWDSRALQNYYFFCDYSQHTNRVWDGIDGSARVAPYGPTTRANSTGKHGYRTTATIAQSAGAGPTWSATGLVQVLFVTQLISGGYRATLKTITLAAVGNKIDFTSVAMDSTFDQFYFDINALATTIYCTKPGDPIFYKVPVAYMSTGTNPLANNVTTFSITPMTDAQLQAGGDIENTLSLPTGYFTSQVDTPLVKFMEIFADSLCMAGDPNYPSSVWISAQLAPQVWSTYGKTFGNRIDVAPNDGEIVTGIRVSDGALFVAKQHNLYRVDFTGDVNNPFRVRLVHGGLGTLSHWSMLVLPKGLFFLSERGPSICYGTYSNLTPTAGNILNLFGPQPSDAPASPYIDQALLPYAFSCNDPSRNRTYTAVRITSGGTRKNGLLVYDYDAEEFYIYTFFVQTGPNVLALVGNSSGILNLWYGVAGITGIVNYLTSTSFFTTSSIETPFMNLGEPNEVKDGAWIWVYGNNATTAVSSVLTITVYTDNEATAKQTITVDMANANYPKGIGVPLAPSFRSIKLAFSAAIDGTVPFELNSFAIEYTTEGERQ